MPTVIIFGDNEDPFGATKLEQEPLFKLEDHLTRNLNQALWLSIDALYEVGGDTTTDGVSDDNSQRSFNLGGTVGINLRRGFSGQISYGKTISSNTSGLDGHMLRLKLQFAF